MPKSKSNKKCNKTLITPDKNQTRLYKQNQVTDNISRALFEIKEIDSLGNAKTIFNNTTTEFQLTIENYTEFKNCLSSELHKLGKVNQSTAKLLDCLLIKMTEEGFNTPFAKLSLKEYAEMTDKKDLKELRKKTKLDLDILASVRITRRHNKDNYKRTHLCGGTYGIENGKIIFKFNDDFFKIFISQKYFLSMPLEALQFNERQHPHSYLLYKKIVSHRRINLGKPRENIISVKTLYDYCSTLTRYETVTNSGRAISQRIIEPFERDLDAITAFSWEYVGLCNEEKVSFDEWLQRKVKIIWRIEFPKEDSILSGQDKQRKKVEKAKQSALVQAEKQKLKNKNKGASD